MDYVQRKTQGGSAAATAADPSAAGQRGRGGRLRAAGSYEAGQSMLAPVQRKGGADDAATRDSEAFRLRQEMSSLASRNAWSGVESYFQQLTALGVELTGEDFFLGAQAARSLGNTASYLHRTKLAAARGATAEEIQELEAAVDSIEAAYGDVVITHREKRLKKKQAAPPLLREVMPFAPDQRKSIETAQEQLAESGSFIGMLPVGTYQLGGESYDVIAKEIGAGAVQMRYAPVERSE